MPVLLGHMGPVKAASFRVSRRIANTPCARAEAVSELRGAGNVRHHLDRAVPEAGLDKESLATWPPPLRSLEGSRRGVRILARPASGPALAGGRRASGRSSSCVEESGEHGCSSPEGDPEAMRALVRIVAAEKLELIPLRARRRRRSAFRALHLATPLVRCPGSPRPSKACAIAGLSARRSNARVASALGGQLRFALLMEGSEGVESRRRGSRCACRLPAISIPFAVSTPGSRRCTPTA